ncbi:hypothetical protein DSO57_1000664 [Entomophthora muscae]|uniref:Uncharacterized protein n=1 Tax=Entomophthora muscae TaxID=34485 RepID=A0ACC2TW94_9FUNG|nr:hypothetical protein DSO57_1000664 [Entomophthora muscae]
MTPPHTLQPNCPQESVATDESTSTQVFGPQSCGELSLLGLWAVRLQALRNPPRVGSLTDMLNFWWRFFDQCLTEYVPNLYK